VDSTSDIYLSTHHTALRCLFLVGMHHGVQVPHTALAAVDEKDIFRSVLRTMNEVELKGKVLRRCKWKHMAKLGTAFPAIAVQKGGNWVIVLNVVPTADGGVAAAILDPRTEQAGMMLVPQEKFVEGWDGVLVLCRRSIPLSPKDETFSLRWFLPQIMRQGSSLRDVAVAAIVISVLGFASPLLFQIIIDKVVPHRSYHTLTIVIVVFTVVMLFEGVFTYVRQYLMLLATNKIDARLSSFTYRHLLSLPMQFFESHSAGVLNRHMQQAESIRNFLTGRLFSTGLDLVFLPLSLTLLAMVSFQLTMVVLLFSLALGAWIAAMMPIFRGYLDKLYQAEAARQGQMVETIHGMRTIKSLALETSRKSSWDDKTAVTVKRYAAVGRIGIMGGVFSHFLERSMMMAVLGLGAVEVFDGTLSVGALVAFNMLQGRVTGPLLSIVGLINEYQQVALSVRMLGTVMTHPEERDPNQVGIRPRITGQIEFDNVTFSYQGAANPAVDRVSFRIEEGQMIGVVGRSGSGKSTLTRLIQGINTAQHGLIRLDGIDVRHIDLPHLRRSIGVVLQDNFLFRGTIRENIAIAKPDASLEQVMEVARMAGAEEFIDRLPLSYETMVEENGANFSGGQRQRLAIARALLSQPKLLIFDEATSALDPESETIVQNNLNDIARGRTMFLVSHRLSSLVRSDAILVLDQGKVVDFAPHDTLVQRCDVYRHLWQQQTQHFH